MSLRLVGAVAIGALLAAPAHASPLELFGFGGRSPALAATGAATTTDFDAVYLNPAGLGDVRGKRLAVGTLFGTFALDGVNRAVDDAVGIEIGGALALPLGGWLKDRLGIGIGLYVPTNDLNRARTPTPGTPFYAVLEDRSEVVGAQFAIGLRLSERWSVGGGFLALATLKGLLNVQPDAAGRFATTSEEQIVLSYAPVLGVRWRTSDALSLAATLHFSSESPYNIFITNHIGDVLPVTLPEIRIGGVAQYDPLIAVVEAAWRPVPAVLLVGAAAYEHWGAYPAPTENVLESAGPAPSPGFHDTVVPRLAVELSGPERLAFRAGYQLVPTPAPDGSSFIDDTRHVFSLGVGLDAAPLHVDAFAQAHLLVGRTDGAVSSGGHVLVGGMMLGVDL
jgi:long-chain fatty acid transport protein